MKLHTKTCVLSLALGLLVPVSGCSENNEKQAKIEGSLPTDGLTTQQRREKATGLGPDAKSSNYPGTGGSAPATTGGNNRKK